MIRVNLNYDKPLETMRQAVELATDARPVIGALLPPISLAMVPASGQATADLAGNVYARMQVQINSKDPDQRAALQRLTDALQALYGFEADSDAWQITGVSAHRPPAYIGLDAGNMHIYSAQVVARLFMRGDTR